MDWKDNVLDIDCICGGYTLQITYNEFKEKETNGENIICPKCKYEHLSNEIEIKKEMYNLVEKVSKRSEEEAITEYQAMKSLRENIFKAIDEKKPNKANEYVVKYILENENIYTIRDDEKSEMWIYCKDGADKGIYLPNGKTYVKQYCREILKSGYTPQKANNIIAKIETDTYVNQEDFFKTHSTYDIPVKNGILDLLTKQIFPFTPNRIYFNKLPIFFDKEKDCPYIKKHFQEVLEFSDDIQVIQEIFGWLLVKDYNPEKAIMFTGTGRNGKGKSIELMKRFLGSENCVNIPLKSLEGDDNFNISELHNKLANLGSDISNDTLKETNKFKELTGHDMVSASRKFKIKIHFQNFAKMIFSANELPKTHDTTLAFFNRWIILDFPYTFLPKGEYEKEKESNKIKLRDDNIIDKITSKDEMSGLLNWALDGLYRLKKEGNFSKCQSTNEVKNTWVRKSDSFTSFLIDIIDQDYDSYVKKQDLKIAYNEYVRKYKLKPASDRHIKHILSTEYGVSEIRTKIADLTEERVLCWEGIRFKKKYEDIPSFDRVVRLTRLFSPYSKNSILALGVKKGGNPDNPVTIYKGDKMLYKLAFEPVNIAIDLLLKQDNPLPILKIQEKFDFDINPVIDKMIEKGEIMETKPGYIQKI